MSIARFENITIKKLTFSKDAFGEQETTISNWFQTRARVRDVANSVKISEKYRLYQDLVNLTVNYTPNMKKIVEQQNLFSIVWRNQDWRITDAKEANDRMTITFMCYRSDPTTAV